MVRIRKGARLSLFYASEVPARILVIDNFDSFVYNLVQYIGQLGAEPIVHREGSIDLDEVRQIAPDGILISPGPGRPEQATLSNQIIGELHDSVPILGVCLGMQCIGEVFGASVVRAPEIVHGKTSEVIHDSEGIFEGIPTPLEVTRYHSLIVDSATIPDELSVTATTQSGLVMGLRHKSAPLEGVQFHPESVLTDRGLDMVGNFLAICGH
ncbi:MAG: aminodeoxychorismate/anthranilate synthase component II [Microthrixaceae bacterium]|nr:aminodeoxychorismate/anthranilate synthase component II [Microthrixaceae bacterium]